MRRRSLVAGAGLLAVAALGALDYAVGRELGLSLFYAVPVFVVARRAGLVFGLGLAVAAAATWAVADAKAGATYRHEWIPYWNATTRFGYFAMAVAVARMRSGLEVEAARARRDPLTGLLNRRGFLEIAGQEVERSRRFRHSMTVAYLDCDDFKIVNDTRGHDVGDRLLCIIAGVMQSSLRALDVPARVGGDEFVVLLPETEADEARDTLERLRAAVRAALTPAGYAVTLSIGAVTLARPPDSVEAVLEHADRVMYRAKHRGKARLEQDVVAGDDDQGDASPGSRLE